MSLRSLHLPLSHRDRERGGREEGERKERGKREEGERRERGREGKRKRGREGGGGGGGEEERSERLLSQSESPIAVLPPTSSLGAGL